MIVIGILLLLAVLLDGLRRMRRERLDQLSVAAKMGGGNKHKDDEFPLADFEPPKSKVGQESAKPRIEPSVDDDEAAIFFAADDASGETSTPPSSNGDKQRQSKPKPKSDAKAKQKAKAAQQKQSADSEATAEPAVEEIIIVNVRAKNELGFNGADLLQILLACDMRFGKHKIFHRHEHKNGTGAIQFSMANAVEPGVFDLNNIEDFHTSGVSFFLSLPGPEDPIKAFDYMVETANCLANNLSGELRDAEKCSITAQTLEHHRQRVQEFERRQLAHSH
ncbi:MAG: cell division protein ZipA [Pseudomonadales bacterium]